MWWEDLWTPNLSLGSGVARDLCKFIRKGIRITFMRTSTRPYLLVDLRFWQGTLFSVRFISIAKEKLRPSITRRWRKPPSSFSGGAGPPWATSRVNYLTRKAMKNTRLKVLGQIKLSWLILRLKRRQSFSKRDPGSPIAQDNLEWGFVLSILTISTKKWELLCPRVTLVWEVIRDSLRRAKKTKPMRRRSDSRWSKGKHER